MKYLIILNSGQIIPALHIQSEGLLLKFIGTLDDPELSSVMVTFVKAIIPLDK